MIRRWVLLLAPLGPSKQALGLLHSVQCSCTPGGPQQLGLCGTFVQMPCRMQRVMISKLTRHVHRLRRQAVRVS